MSEDTKNPLVEENESEENQEQPTELQLLKQRADAMGITYSNNIGVDALKKKINDKMEGTEVNEVTKPQDSQPNPLAQTSEKEVQGNDNVAAQPQEAKPVSLRDHLLKDAMKLVRIRISCMDPKKADLPGEFFTVANEYIGTVRKYVPFGEATDAGYHVPNCIYEMLKERQFLQITTKRHPVTGQIEVKNRYMKEFAIEVLPQLTPEELADLAADQRATGRLGSEE